MTLRADLAKQAYLARILTRFANEEWNSIPKAVFEFYPGSEQRWNATRRCTGNTSFYYLDISVRYYIGL